MILDDVFPLSQCDESRGDAWAGALTAQPVPLVPVVPVRPVGSRVAAMVRAWRAEAAG